jgi:hypothetical protein
MDGSIGEVESRRYNLEFLLTGGFGVSGRVIDSFDDGELISCVTVTV